jgi:CRP-like cAMP-binding protein
MNLVAIAARRLAVLQDRGREISTQPIEQRVANALLRMAEVGSRAKEGQVLIRLPFTRRDIASLAGTTLYSASRIIANWRRIGLIETEEGKTIIVSVEKLRRIGDRI